jgi:GT2 family glycosyltransferase
MTNQVSVIIVNYNGKKWLKKCFDSLLSQTYKNFEIIFVDNNSSDNSIDFIEKNYKDERIKIIKSDDNLGFAGGNNLGINEAKGDYILFLNNDTWVENNFIKDIFDFYKNNSYDVVAPYERNYDPNIELELYKISIDILGQPIYFKKKLSKSKEFYLSGVSLFFSKKLYQGTKGLDNNFFMYFEEIDWFWRLHLLNKTFSHIPDVFVYHKGAGSTGDGIKYMSFLWRNQNTLQMLLKNYYTITLIFILPIYILQNIIEMIFFLIVLKPKISLSYLQGWYFNIRYLNRTLGTRSWVQSNRKINDWKLMKNMYIGFGKAIHFIRFFNIIKI